MAEDVQDQGTPSALRPRPGWDKSARNPDIVHGPIDPAEVPSSGYLSSYQPPKGPSPPHSEDAGELDQSVFTAEQQGHKLGRTKGSPTAGGSSSGSAGRGGGSESCPLPEIPQLPADGRPGWDGRFHLERTAWEAAPRTVLLRPPSPSGSLPSVSPNGAGRRRSVDGPGYGAFSDTGAQPPRRLTGTDGLDVEASGHSASHVAGNTDAFGGRATILPGLNATSPALRTSPYFSSSGAPASPGRDAGGGGAAAGAGPKPQGAKRQSVTTLSDTYIGRAYSPDEQQKRGAGLDGTTPNGGGGGGGGSGGAGADADDEGGVDGHGTHLPALDRAYFGRPAADARKEAEKAAAQRAADAANRRRSERHSKIDLLGAVYMPNKKRGAPQSSKAADLAVSGCGPVSSRLYPGPGMAGPGHEAGGAGGNGNGVIASRNRDTGIAGPWRPSGRQPFPEDVPSVARPKVGAMTAEEQAEADRRRSQPRDPSTYSPERYPTVGQGWSPPPEKFPPNPAYAGVRAKYMEAKRPQSDTEGDAGKATLHMPDIHAKPWLMPGKHLLTDSSAPAPKMSGTAGARPAYGFSPAATAASAHSTLRTNNKGTARSGGGKARGKGKGKGKAGGGGSSSGSGSEVEGDREELTVIGGVRLVSMIRRQNMTDEAKLEADEDVQFRAEDAAADEQKRSSDERGGEEGAGEEKSDGAHSEEEGREAAAEGDGERSKARKEGAREEEEEEEEERGQGATTEQGWGRRGAKEEDDGDGTGGAEDGAAGVPIRDVASSYSVQRSSTGPNGERSFDDADGADAGGAAGAAGAAEAVVEPEAEAKQDAGEEGDGEGSEAGAGKAAAEEAGGDEAEGAEGGDEGAGGDGGEEGDAAEEAAEGAEEGAGEDQEEEEEEEEEGPGDDEDDEGLAGVGIAADSDGEELEEVGVAGAEEEDEDGSAPLAGAAEEAD